MLLLVFVLLVFDASLLLLGSRVAVVLIERGGAWREGAGWMWGEG